MLVHEAADFWLLDKPTGIAINDEADKLGFITLFREHYNIAQAHPVHRLDKATSGLLLVAKHAEANRELSHAFELRQIEKRYLAIVSAKPGHKIKKKSGWVKGDMKPSRLGNWKLLTTQLNPAVTQFVSQPLGERRRFCILKPHTGKTHQLRVAMKALASPIIGDERYGGEAADRLYLHAYSLAFEYRGQAYAFQRWPSTGVLFAELAELGLNDTNTLVSAL